MHLINTWCISNPLKQIKLVIYQTVIMQFFTTLPHLKSQIFWPTPTYFFPKFLIPFSIFKEDVVYAIQIVFQWCCSKELWINVLAKFSLCFRRNFLFPLVQSLICDPYTGHILEKRAASPKRKKGTFFHFQG